MNRPEHAVHPPVTVWRFDGWTLRSDLGELAKDGVVVRLQDQPLLILQELLARPGELVTREHLIATLWPRGVVDFETGLNTAVRKLRVALHEQADVPRYIETVPRKGYRFIGQVDPPLALHPSAQSTLPDNPAPSIRDSAPVHRSPAVGWIAAAAIVTSLAFGGWWMLSRDDAAAPAVAQRSAAPVAVSNSTLTLLPFASTGDAAGLEFAGAMTELVRERLTRLDGVTVVSGRAPTLSTKAHSATVRTGKASDYILDGHAQLIGTQFRVQARLVDNDRQQELWSETFERPIAQAGTVREEIIERVTTTLHLKTPQTIGETAVDLDAYRLYLRGKELAATHRPEEVNTAIELFQRATILDPRFARAFLALGQATLARNNLGAKPPTPQEQADVLALLQRALDLDATLGEAWIERARLTSDPVQAEELILHGLKLAPNYGTGYQRLAEFLFSNSRSGEAIGAMDRALVIDPHSPALRVRQSFFVMVARSDVQRERQLLNEALAIDPGHHSANMALARSYWEYTGEFAEAAAVIERVSAMGATLPVRLLARDIYLDLGEPDAARHAINGKSLPVDLHLGIAQYERDIDRAAQIAAGTPTDYWMDGGPFASNAEALRDNAMAKGDYHAALEKFRSFESSRSRNPRMWHRAFALVHAHALMLSGDDTGGRQLIRSTLEMLDAHDVGRVQPWFSRERATAFALLGEDEKALGELRIAVRTGQVYRWWYLAGMDPAFAHLRTHPRFVALDEQARERIDEQRRLRQQRMAART